MASRLGWLVWCLPAALFGVGIAWSAGRPWLWVPSLAIARAAWFANASRCGRLHCFVTGPLFLFGAVATLVSAAGLLAIDWRLVLAAVVAAAGAGYRLERLRGKYVGAEQAGEGSSP